MSNHDPKNEKCKLGQKFDMTEYWTVTEDCSCPPSGEKSIVQMHNESMEKYWDGVNERSREALKAPTSVTGDEWVEETKRISDAWWNYWNYQGTPDRDLIQKWWFKQLAAQRTQIHKTFDALLDTREDCIKQALLGRLDKMGREVSSKDSMGRNVTSVKNLGYNRGLSEAISIINEELA